MAENPETPKPYSRLLLVILAGCALVILFWFLQSGKKADARKPSAAREVGGKDAAQNARNMRSRGIKSAGASSTNAAEQPTAEQIVAEKVSQFAHNRRDLAYRMAQKFSCEVTSEMEQFFQAIEAGSWAEADALFKNIRGNPKFDGGYITEFPGPLWPVIHETYYVAKTARDWPPQALLDYGNLILNSLAPGMVYVGGTDPGRFIPTLLNETTEGERHIVLTQNALADRLYLDFLGSLHGDRFATLTQDDSQRAFQDYITDAQRRLQHDQQFPGEPKQIRPGEDVRISGNSVNVSGQIAVMVINGNLLQAIMARNPDARFAMEESFPMEWSYSGATPAGPIMRLNSGADAPAMTREAAQESLQYWQDRTGQLSATPGSLDSSDVRDAYSKLAESQANLLAHQNYTAEAEQIYSLARQLSPNMLEPVEKLSELLNRTGRQSEALQLLDTFLQQNPEKQKDIETIRQRLIHPAWPSPK